MAERGRPKARAGAVRARSGRRWSAGRGGARAPRRWRCGRGSCWPARRARPTRRWPSSWGSGPRRWPSGGAGSCATGWRGCRTSRGRARPRTITDEQVEQVIVKTLEEATAGPGHALVDPVDGRGDRAVPDGDLADLAGVRAQAAPGRDLEAVHRSAVHRQGPRRRRPVPGPAGAGAGAGGGREVPDAGAGPHRPGAADDARRTPAGRPTTTSATAPPACSPPWTWPPARSSASTTAATATRSSCGSSRPIDASVPAELDLHLICDNYATHKTPAIKTWLLRHPRFHLHFTPTSSSLAQPGRALVRRAHQPQAAPLHPPQRHRTRSRRQRLDRRLERRPQAVRLDQDRRRDPRHPRRILQRINDSGH